MAKFTTNEIIGKNIRILRNMQELTQAQLADELCINPRHLGNIEQGRRNVTISLLDKLCNFFNKPHVYFFMLNENNSENDLLKSAFEIVKSSDKKIQNNVIKMINILTEND